MRPIYVQNCIEKQKNAKLTYYKFLKLKIWQLIHFLNRNKIILLVTLPPLLWLWGPGVPTEP